jgi:hypothetical protein
MIDRVRLLTDLQNLLVQLQEDLRQRCAERPEVEVPLREQHEAARAAQRTAEAYETWRESMFAQAGVAWILGCVFVRFLEDNELLDNVYLSGPRGRLSLGRDYRTNYFRKNPRLSDREFLEHIFREVRQLPGMGDLFDERHNPLWSLGLSGDGALALVEIWYKLDASTGYLAHDFTDPEWNTRFLGDLYQDLSDEAKKRYALLQTPEFIEEFILDRTLSPAIEAFGYEHVRMIDPTCGSAHFLLGGFRRLFALHQQNHPAVEVRALAQRALDQVYGVDLNPNVVAIARFRLLLEVLRMSSVERLRNAPAFRINVGTGDSLLHGAGQTYFQGDMGVRAHHYESEDADLVLHILSQRYHAVVGNPPYIGVKDRALNRLYRERFGSCYRKYSLAAPFMEVFFALAIKAEQDSPTPAGYIGMITTNSFMKREFGKKLIEEYIPRWDLRHIVDTSDAFIPGHPTSTVILFGRNQRPVSPTIRTVMGIRGEQTEPVDPSRGLVWRAILQQIDHPGTQSDFISVADLPRENFYRHPWTIGGGGAAELKEMLDEAAQKKLREAIQAIGPSCILGDDEAFTAPLAANCFRRLPDEIRRTLVQGDDVRNWSVTPVIEAIFPYSSAIKLRSDSVLLNWLWPLRTLLSARKDFGQLTYAAAGRPFHEYHQIPVERNKAELLITFADVATHNEFALARGGRIFNRHAPIIQLPQGTSVTDFLALLGLLNSSIACFWLKQVTMSKGLGGQGGGIKPERWHRAYEFDGTKLNEFPIPAEKPLKLAEELDRLARDLNSQTPAAILHGPGTISAEAMDSARIVYESTLHQMIAMQEELDWQYYEIFGVLAKPDASDALPDGVSTFPSGIKLGERAFEIVLARKQFAGEVETAWFEIHRSTPVTALPPNWPDSYRQIVEKRIRLIETDRNVRLIEQPEYKRRWSTESWEEQKARALRACLLKRLEKADYWAGRELTTCAHLADELRRDAEFIKLANLYRGRPDYELTELVLELVEIEAVPFLSVLRYRLSGLRKRHAWEHTDHGHVLDYQSVFRRGQAGADRYRSDQQPPEADEVLIQGFRVGKTLGGRFVAPSSEKIYYTSRKNGYHGGVAPQELIVPLAVLAAETFDVGALVSVPQHVPSWWSGETAAVEARTSPTPVGEKPKPTAKAKAEEELPLFAATRKAAATTTTAWIERLLNSALFAKQCELAGRTVPQKDQVRLILVALDDRGGVILKNVLSERVQIPGLRMNGVLAVLRRILNVDGYPVLMVDEDGETIRLNRQLLMRQFELE